MKQTVLLTLSIILLLTVTLQSYTIYTLRSENLDFSKFQCPQIQHEPKQQLFSTVINLETKQVTCTYKITSDKVLTRKPSK